MNALLDDSLVGMVLLASSLYVFAALGPKKARRRMLTSLALLLARVPHLRAAAQRLARGAEDKAQGACGGCHNCAAEARPALRVQPQTDAGCTDAGRADAGRADAGRADAGRAEIRVPLANIARLRRPRPES